MKPNLACDDVAASLLSAVITPPNRMSKFLRSLEQVVCQRRMQAGRFACVQTEHVRENHPSTDHSVNQPKNIRSALFSLAYHRYIAHGRAILKATWLERELIRLSHALIAPSVVYRLSPWTATSAIGWIFLCLTLTPVVQEPPRQLRP